jgi:predicted nucleic acid-binding protein
MAAVVLDASIASAWCFPDEQTDYTIAVLQAVSSSTIDAVAPHLWAYEIRNSTLMGLRRGLIGKTDSKSLSRP